jgi:ribosomal protein S18 acetylase RimI-like enzyme
MNVSIRPARPEDAAQAAPLIFSAGPNAFNFVFSHRTRLDAQGFIAHAFKSDRGEFSWRYHRVAELEGEVVGTAVGYTGAMAMDFLWPAVRHIFHCYGVVGAARVIRRGLQVEKIIVPPSRAELFYIGNVAVLPALRGRGIGRQIMEHMQAEGLKLGASLCALDVSAENPRAQALYTQMGYRVVKENPSTLQNEAGRVATHRRMELEL